MDPKSKIRAGQPWVKPGDDNRINSTQRDPPQFSFSTLPSVRVMIK
jgi:hypothetical protein